MLEAEIAVVAGEDHDRVLLQSEFTEPGHHAADHLIDPRDHRVVDGHVSALVSLVRGVGLLAAPLDVEATRLLFELALPRREQLELVEWVERFVPARRQVWHVRIGKGETQTEGIVPFEFVEEAYAAGARLPGAGRLVWEVVERAGAPDLRLPGILELGSTSQVEVL